MESEIIPYLVDQHAEEAAFLWLLRRAAVQQPHYLLSDLVRLDDRIEAHLDGLRISSTYATYAWEIVETILSKKPDGGELFTAAWLALQSEQDRRLELIVNSVRSWPSLARAVVSAIAWSQIGSVTSSRVWLDEADPLLRYIRVAALAVTRQISEKSLSTFLADTDARVRARALRGAGECGLKDALPEVLHHLQDSDLQCRYEATWSASLLGNEQAAAALMQLMQVLPETASASIPVALRRMSLGAGIEWRRSLCDQARSERLAVSACAATGDLTAVVWLLEQLSQPHLARSAAEAFSSITGVNILYDGFQTLNPPAGDSGPTENPADENIDLDPDENLPWPDAEKVRQWWSDNQRRFSPGVRYLLGHPIEETWAREVLVIGLQRQRAAAALELAFMNPGQAVFNVEAPGFQQHSLLGIQ